MDYYTFLFFSININLLIFQGESSDSDASEEDTLVQRLGLNNYEAEAAKRFKADDIHSSDDDQKDGEGGSGDSRKKKEMARKRA